MASIAFERCAEFTFPLAALPTLARPERASSDVTTRTRQLAEAMGRAVLEVDADVFTSAAVAFRKAVATAREIFAIGARREVHPREAAGLLRHPGVLPWREIEDAYGIGSAFADVRMGVEWPKDEPEAAA